MNIIQDLSRVRGRQLPVVAAAEAVECGLACLTMIARYHGHDVDLNGLRQRFSISLSGATLRHLMEIADRLSLAARPLRVELASLSKVRVPAVLHWNLDHFVVLKSIGRGRAVIHDPAFGRREMTMDELSKHFTGIVLELTPAAGFVPQRARMPMRLSRLWSRLDGLGGSIVQALLLSLALQICAFAAPFQMQLVVDEGLFHSDRDLLLVLALGFGALAIVQASVEALRNWVLRIFGQLLTFQVLGNLIHHLIRLPADFFAKRHVGDIMSRLQSVQPIQDAISRGLISATIDGGMALFAGALLFFYSPWLALIVIIAVALNLGVSLLAFPAMRARMEEEILARSKEMSHLLETVRAMTTIRIMGGEPTREGIWRNLQADALNAGLAVGRWQISLGFTQQGLTGLQTVLVVYFGATAILDSQGFSVGMLIAFLSFRQTFTDRAMALISKVVQFRLLTLHLDRLSDIVNAEPETSGGTLPALDVKGGIAVRGLEFRYGATDPLILEGVDLTIKPGEFVAITGPSGGGKSTLMKLLIGLNAPGGGSIELDGHRATPDLWRAWRQAAGVVSQDDQLLSGSIADNIAFFDPDLDMARVQAAAMAAQVHDDIARTPMQYLTLVGDMGSTLSGGQRQRVLLARALYRQPRVLLLDEGTANLDAGTEAAVADIIAALPITRIVVAHRPALVQRASRVFHVGDRQVTDVTRQAGKLLMAA